MLFKQLEPAMYHEHTDLKADEWRYKLENSEVNNYTFIDPLAAVHVINGVAYIKKYDPVSRGVATYEVREAK